jgi:hypothetical protein
MPHHSVRKVTMRAAPAEGPLILPGVVRGGKLEKSIPTPDPKLVPAGAALRHGGLDQLVIDRPVEPRLEPIAEQDEGGEATIPLRAKAQWMIRIGGDFVVDIGAEDEALLPSASLDLHLHGDERRFLDPDQRSLRWGYKIVMSVRLTPQHRGEKLDQLLSPDWAILIIPGAVAADLEADITAILRLAALWPA